MKTTVIALLCTNAATEPVYGQSVLNQVIEYAVADPELW